MPSKYYKDIESCGSNPCLNGATCLPNLNTLSYSCLCKSGYTGQDCQTGNTIFC